MKKWIIFLLLFTTIAATLYARSIEGRYRDMAFRADSLEAANDTARDVGAQLRGQLDSTVNVFQRRIVQVELERDSIDRALGEQSRLRAAAELRMDTLRIVDTVEVAVLEDDSVQVYEFAGDPLPFHYLGRARLFPSGSQLFDLTITADPVTVRARMTCRDTEGVRAASLLLEADEPWRLVPSEVVADRGVCNPQPPRFRWIPEFTPKGVGVELLKFLLYWRLGDYLEDKVETGAPGY